MKELIEIQSQLKAPKGQFNKFGGYKYRSCEDILEAVKPLLAKTGCVLLLSDKISVQGDWHYITATATLINSEGVSVSTEGHAREEAAKKGMDASQITGSASSYARKYALNGLFCIDDTKDSDATNTNGKEVYRTFDDIIVTGDSLLAPLATEAKAINDKAALRAFYMKNKASIEGDRQIQMSFKNLIIEKSKSL